MIERAAGVGPLQFREPLDVTKGSRAWLIVDPPDGRIPTGDAGRTAAHRTAGSVSGHGDSRASSTPDNARRSSFDAGTFTSLEDFGLWERCITRGFPGAMMPHILGNSSDRPGARAGRIRYELIHDVRVIPLDGRPHVARPSTSKWEMLAAAGTAMRS